MEDISSYEEHVKIQMKLLNDTFDKENEIKQLIIKLNSSIVQLNILNAKMGKGVVDIGKFVINDMITQATLNDNYETAYSNSHNSGETGQSKPLGDSNKYKFNRVINTVKIRPHYPLSKQEKAEIEEALMK